MSHHSFFLLFIVTFIFTALLSDIRAQLVPHHYIVTLTSYRPHRHQLQQIRRILSLLPPTIFQIIPRPNIAASLSTDFVLLHTQSLSVLTALRQSTFVHHVTPHKAISRFPQAVPPSHHHDQNAHALPRIHAFNAAALWRLNYTGAGVHVAVFDTGIAHSIHFPTVRTATDWTHENTTEDSVGHGTFVASLIASRNPACPGLAPDANLHIFRVFTGSQVSYTSWFLDAFNYALHLGIDVLNLSIGGPDFADLPFIDKINELTSSGVLIVSAIGNDGPLWGTLNNPADMMDVVGVAGSEPDAQISSFSSRGMSMHEFHPYLPRYGRVKPDLVAYARSLTASSNHPPSCTRLSGTSVASPVVAAAIALLISSVPKEERSYVINPATLKIALLRSSARMRYASMYEQGSGLLRIEEAYKELRKLRFQFSPNLPLRERASSPAVLGPRAAFFPPYLDLTANACPYMWPHCTQPLFKTGMPVTLNVTILNPGGVEAVVHSFEWESVDSEFLTVRVSPPERFWPWAGGLGVHFLVEKNPQERKVVEGILRARVVSVHENTHSDIQMPIKVALIPTPPRSKRLLWDVFHSIRYPPGYVPRDGLHQKKDMLDWLGDHPHTNFHALFRSFIAAGFYIDILDHSLECLDKEAMLQYGALLLFDSEDYFSQVERDKIETMVKDGGMALVVAAEWYNVDLMKDICFEDDNTRSFWTPIMAGANVPSLNKVLRPHGIAFGDAVISGRVKTSTSSFRFESGVPIVKLPAKSEVLFASNIKIHEKKGAKSTGLLSSHGIQKAAVLGLTKSGNGTVLAYGDTNCIDTAYSGTKCYEFFVKAVHHAIFNCAGRKECLRLSMLSMRLGADLVPSSDAMHKVASPLPMETAELFLPHSKVLRKLVRRSQTRFHEQYVSWDCSLRYIGQVKPLFRQQIKLKVEFPRFDLATPMGSERNYYREVVSFRWPRWKNLVVPPMDTDTYESAKASQVLSSWDVGPHMHSLRTVFVGIFFLMGSFWLRRRRKHESRRMGAKTGRRHVKFRSKRYNFSSASGSSCDTRDSGLSNPLPTSKYHINVK